MDGYIIKFICLLSFAQENCLIIYYLTATPFCIYLESHDTFLSVVKLGSSLILWSILFYIYYIIYI